jgi:hypothetical protein
LFGRAALFDCFVWIVRDTPRDHLDFAFDRQKSSLARGQYPGAKIV